jgi:hydroxymethylglutaryl-CoA lyase
VGRFLGEVRCAYPDIEISLHLHDTRGMAITNAYVGLSMGVRYFDSSIGGLGGCPFSGSISVAGNICTEDLVFLCHEMGIETGIDLEGLRAAAHLAQRLVGHPLPGKVMNAGGLDAKRSAAAAATLRTA